MQINSFESAGLGGLALSAATATALSVGSWPAAIGTGVVSVITVACSALSAACIADSFTNLVRSPISEGTATGIFVISSLVALVALNSLALSAVIWTGLPIATLSLTAKAATSIAVTIPVALFMVTALRSSEGSARDLS